MRSVVSSYLIMVRYCTATPYVQHCEVRTRCVLGSLEPRTGVHVHLKLVQSISMMSALSKFFFSGELGASLAAKTASDYLSGTNLLASAEAMTFGVNSGVDKHLLYKVIRDSTGQSFMCDHVSPASVMVAYGRASREYERGFKAQMTVKYMTFGCACRGGSRHQSRYWAGCSGVV